MKYAYDLTFNDQAVENDDVIKRGPITTTTTDPARSVCTSHSEMSTVYFNLVTFNDLQYM